MKGILLTFTCASTSEVHEAAEARELPANEVKQLWVWPHAWSCHRFVPRGKLKSPPTCKISVTKAEVDFLVGLLYGLLEFYASADLICLIQPVPLTSVEMQKIQGWNYFLSPWKKSQSVSFLGPSLYSSSIFVLIKQLSSSFWSSTQTKQWRHTSASM